MMAEQSNPQGPFTLWQNLGREGWAWKDYPTLKEAIDEGERYGEYWVAMKAVDYVPIEVDE